MLVYVAVRLTEAQVRALDEYRERHGGLARSAAVRDLTAQQLRYQKWVDERRKRNLPPYPTTRLPKLEVTEEKMPRIAEVVGSLRERNPDASDEDLGRMLLGSMNVFRGLKEKTRKLVRRVAREHENEALERGMNADLERRAKVREDPPEARE